MITENDSRLKYRRTFLLEIIFEKGSTVISLSTTNDRLSMGSSRTEVRMSETQTDGPKFRRFMDGVS